VGYGDRYRVTPEGRLVAVFLMAGGVGVFGTFSGLVASWFLAPAAAEAESGLEDVRGMLKRLVATSEGERNVPVATFEEEARAAPEQTVELSDDATGAGRR
jgi:hypothetical protein